MRISTPILISLSLLILVISFLWRQPQPSPHSKFLKCLISEHKSYPPISLVVYTPHNSTYKSVIDAYIQNPRFLTPTPQPVAVVAPVDESQIRATLLFSVRQGLKLRVRSGGHDFEGASFRSKVPFVIMDLFNYRAISVDVDSRSAWVETGADLGEVYYAVSQAKGTLGFPGGYWSTVGTGGHISGGGFGPLIRMYGLAADNVLDAKFMDVNGRVLDRETMGEDLFWALRGGGGGNFGVVLAWKLNLVEVPEVVTICKVKRSLEQGVTATLHKWQSVANTMPKELEIEVNLKSLESGKRTIVGTFRATYLGGFEDLLSLMDRRFLELGLTKEDCSESSWIDAIILLSQFPAGSTTDILLNRTAPPRPHTKQKADYVVEPIPIEGLEGLWEIFHQMDPGMAEMNWTPYGGRMSEISDSESPYPHRSEVLFMIYEAVYWDAETEGGPAAPPRQLKWIRDLYRYMTPYVSKNPRRSYANYRDFDLGVNNMKGKMSYEEASASWGTQYFMNNFKRLAQVKGKIDPNNFFIDEQSIPPLS